MHTPITPSAAATTVLIQLRRLAAGQLVTLSGKMFAIDDDPVTVLSNEGSTGDAPQRRAGTTRGWVAGGGTGGGTGTGGGITDPTITNNANSVVLGRTEVTNAQYCAFLNACAIGQGGAFAADLAAQTAISTFTALGTNVMIHPCADDAPWGCTYNTARQKWEPKYGYAKHPVINVTWWGATAFNQWLDALPLPAFTLLSTAAEDYTQPAAGGTKTPNTHAADMEQVA